jgi:acetyl-CoA carboxylase carboxyl transferase subunit beta
MQMAKTTAAICELREEKIPYLVLLADPTTGGVSASLAMLGDIAISEPGAEICFTGARVIQETIRGTLPEGFQRAEYLLEHGMIDRIVSRHDLKQEISTILNILGKR